MNKNEVRDFFDAWSLFDHVLDRNYMFHNEIYDDVAKVLAKRFEVGRYALLDLGCGSARHLAGALRGCPPRQYVGCDLSEVALEHARENLEPVGCPFELRQADFFEGLRGGGDSPDLIFSSFALHHLSTDDKARFFRQAHDRLNPNGAFLLIDVARHEDEDRPTYLDHYCGWIQSDWRDVSREGLNYIYDHIRNCDFPETNSILHAMATQAGFARVFDVNQYRWHRIWLFEKTAHPPLPAG